MNGAMIALKLLDAALMVGEFAAEDRTRLEESAGKLKTMIEEGRDPTDAEWSEINKVSDDALARLAERAGQ